MTSSHGGGLHRDTAKPGEDKETTWDMWHFVMTLAVNFRFTNVEKLGQSIRYTNTIFQLKDSWHQHLHNLDNWYSWDDDVLLHPDVFTPVSSSVSLPTPRSLLSQMMTHLRHWGSLLYFVLQITVSLPSSSLILSSRPASCLHSIISQPPTNKTNIKEELR